jgi:hypothetical protein
MYLLLVFNKINYRDLYFYSSNKDDSFYQESCCCKPKIVIIKTLIMIKNIYVQIIKDNTRLAQRMI